MTEEPFIVVFGMELEDTKYTVWLCAEIEIHHSETYYYVKNIQSPRQLNNSTWPNFNIKKVKDDWVHCDSEKVSKLSMAVGKAIDDYLRHRKRFEATPTSTP